MPSKQSEAVRRRWEAARVAMLQPEGERPDDESWGDLTAEPREVDYLETEAAGASRDVGGAQARQHRPGADVHPRRGFVSGSIYTHRKMFGHLAKAAGARALLVDHRLLPEGGVYPVPVDEVEAAYRWLLAQGTAAGHVAFAGDSVGAGWRSLCSCGPGSRACRCQPRRCCFRRRLTWKQAAIRLRLTGTRIPSLAETSCAG